MSRMSWGETWPRPYGCVTMTVLALIGTLLIAIPAVTVAQTVELFNPYERLKNGPPLNDVWHKARPEWLWDKLHNPKHHPSARMPDFTLTDDEVLDVMAFLKASADPSFPSVQWPAWAPKGEDDMTDDEYDAMYELVDEGDSVWRNARCTICHVVEGPGNSLIGGFVDLRVGGIDLQLAGSKLNRDWLYRWIEEPMSYFPETLMPRFRFTDEEIRSLAEFILRDDIFRPDEEDGGQEQGAAAPPPEWSTLDEPLRAERGEELIESSRCVVCHDIEGMPELYAANERELPPSGENFEFLVYERRCLTCHTVAGRGGTYAPDLTSAGSRLHESWISDFVAAPDLVRPLSQQMPRFNLTEEEARIIASEVSGSFLDALVPADIPEPTVTGDDVQLGAELFSERGCVACHTIGDGPGGIAGPTLGAVADRLQPGYIWHHLTNPRGVNPYSAEPDYGLSDDEARALAAFLSRSTEE